MTNLSSITGSLTGATWRIAGLFSLIISWAILVCFPHICSFRSAWMLAGLLTLSYGSVRLLQRCRNTGIPARHSGDALFYLVLPMVVSLLGMGALNDALYASETGRLTIYDGLMTVGGLMPTSDASGYLSGMQSFIHYGELNNWSLFKPVSILWAAVLYDLTGEDMVLFLRINVLLFSLAAVHLGMVAKRHVGSLFSLMLTWGVSLYFIYFHGTFLTENFSSPFALLAIAFLVKGWQSKEYKSFLAGMALLSMAMVMRPGAMFFLPLLMLVSGFHFAGVRTYSLRIPLLTGLVYVLVVGLSLLQPRLLQNPYRQVSNAAGQLYQIHTNAPSWSIYLTLPYPDTLQRLDDIADAKSVFVEQEIKKDPIRFVRNYISMIIRAFPRPETWVFSFAYQLPGWFKWGVLLLFLLTPWIRDRKDPIRVLFLLLCLNLIGSLLSMPVMEELRTRLMMVTMPLHIMVVVIGLSNGLFLLSPLFHGFLIDPTDGIIKKDKATITDQMMLGSTILLIAGVLLLPVIFDQIRKIEKPSLPKSLMRTFKQHSKILIDMSYTPKAHIDLDRQFPISSPYMISGSKFLSNMPDTTSSLQGRFYLANAVSCFGKPNRRLEASLLIIPDSLMILQRETSARYLLFRIRESGFQQIMHGAIIADSVLWSK